MNRCFTPSGSGQHDPVALAAPGHLCERPDDAAEQLQRGGPALSDAQPADALNITVQRWQEARSSQQAQRMVPISAIPEQLTNPGNGDLEDRRLDLACRS